MILTDRFGHLVSDTDLDELHDFAKALGLKHEWFQYPRRIHHYDLTTQRARSRAVEAGATLVNAKDLVRRAAKCWVPTPPDKADRDALFGDLEHVHEICDGGFVGWFVRGHRDKWVFMDTVDYEDAPDYPDGMIPLSEVVHTYWRCVPTRACYDIREWETMWVTAPGPAPGAFPVTTYLPDIISLVASSG